MSIRMTRAYVVAGVVFAVLLLYHGMARREAFHMQMAVKEGLEQLYATLLMEQARGTNLTLFTTDSLSAALIAGLRYPTGRLPGFVRPEDISVSSTGVVRGATNLLCAVRVSKQLRYGLDGTGVSRAVGQTEFRNWGHVALRTE